MGVSSRYFFSQPMEENTDICIRAQKSKFEDICIKKLIADFNIGLLEKDLNKKQRLIYMESKLFKIKIPQLCGGFLSYNF